MYIFNLITGVIINRETKKKITSLALAVTVTRPYYSIMELREDLRCYPDLFQGITEGVILNILESQVPKQEEILNAITALYSPGSLHAQEERVYLHVENAIRRLSKEGAPEVLHYIQCMDETAAASGLQQ